VWVVGKPFNILIPTPKKNGQCQLELDHKVPDASPAIYMYQYMCPSKAQSAKANSDARVLDIKTTFKTSLKFTDRMSDMTAILLFCRKIMLFL
jgi:hypothetical protein